MKNDNLEDLYNEMLEAQEADMEARGMMDAPDSFQIAGITEEELEESLPPEEEYSERDAFNDFIADQQEDWN